MISLSEAVIRVFVDLYRKGKLYRGKRMTNWDPEAKDGACPMRK